MILYIYLTVKPNWYTLLTQFISTVGVLSRNVTRDNSPSAHLPIQPSIHPNYRSGCSKQLSTLQNRFNTIKSYHTIPNWLLVSLSSVVVKFFSSNVFEYQISLVITSLKSFQSHSLCHHLTNPTSLSTSNLIHLKHGATFI